MLTPQDVRSVQFEKNLRGYRTCLLYTSVLIDQTQLVSPLRQNIGAENLAHIPQRLFPRCV